MDWRFDQAENLSALPRKTCQKDGNDCIFLLLLVFTSVASERGIGRGRGGNGEEVHAFEKI